MASEETIAKTLKNFYGHRLQLDDSRTSRLYLNIGNNNTVLIAKGYSSPSSVGISHAYNGGMGAPNDPAQKMHEFLQGLSGEMRKKYAQFQNIITTMWGIRQYMFPQNTLVGDAVDSMESFAKSLHKKLEPFISIYESRQAAYEEAQSYADTQFSMQTNLTITLYPKLTSEEDFSILKYNNETFNENFRDKMISPASQLKNLLRFLTGRTEYYGINLNTTKEQSDNASLASNKGQKIYVPNPFTFGNTGLDVHTDKDLANKDQGDIVRFRRILAPNGYMPDINYNYGIKGTFRLLSGGMSGGISTSGYEGTKRDIYGAASRSSTGCNFYDNLLVSNISINNSETVMTMKTFDFDSNCYLYEVTPEYINLNISFIHAYSKYDFNELYWALGLSSLSDMQGLVKNNEDAASQEYDPAKGKDNVVKEPFTGAAVEAANDYRAYRPSRGMTRGK